MRFTVRRRAAPARAPILVAAAIITALALPSGSTVNAGDQQASTAAREWGSPHVVAAANDEEPRDPALWPFASSSPWNCPLGSGAQFAADDDPMTQDLRAGSPALNHKVFSNPIFMATEMDPLTTMIEADNSAKRPRYRMPSDSIPDAGTDGVMLVITPDHLFAHETRETVPNGDGTWTMDAHEKIDLAGPGIAPELGIYIGLSAHGGSTIAGMIRTWELEAEGEIRHVLSMGLQPQQLKVGPWPSAVWPATGSDPTEGYGGTIPMGQLFAIKPGTDLEALGLTPAGLVLARALQNFGAYPVDAGTNGPVFFAEPTVRDEYAADMRADLSKIVPWLYPVTNNSPDTPGGGGTPRAPLAPPLAPALPPDSAVRIVAEEADDAEECLATGEVILASSDLELGVNPEPRCGGPQLVGIRFRDLEIPNGAVIASARLRFTTDETSTEPATVVIRAEASDDAGPYSFQDGDISARPVTSTEVIWEAPVWEYIEEATAAQTSPDISALVQEIVGRPGWSPGNDLAFVVSGEGVRVAESYRLTAGQAPVLEVSWDCHTAQPRARRRPFWNRRCAGFLDRSGEQDKLHNYVDTVNDTVTFALVEDAGSMCEALVKAPGDRCAQAEAQLLAFLLNVASGRVPECDCVVDPELAASSVSNAISALDRTLSAPARTSEECLVVRRIAKHVNRNIAVTQCSLSN